MPNTVVRVDMKMGRIRVRVESRIAHFSTWFKVVSVDIRGYGRSAEHAHHVVAHVFFGVRRGDLGGAPVAPDIHADHLEPSGEMGGLVEPKIVIEGIGVDQHQGRAVPRDLVPDIDAVGSAFRHGQSL